MRTCPKCQSTVENDMIFCPHCGMELPAEPAPAAPTVVIEPQPVVEVQPVVEAQPQYQQPQYQQPQYQQPQYQQPQYQQPQYQYEAPKAPSKALKFVGMGLSIEGFATAVLFGLYSFIFSMIEEMAETGMGFGYAFCSLLIALPSCIIGMIFSNKCRDAGDLSTVTKVGKSLGLAGIIVSGVTFFIAILALGAMS